jgi:hypothetical protein
MAAVPQIRMGTNRQMPQTSQVIWLQFRVANTHLSDTLQLEYAGGVHALFTLYRRHGSRVVRLASNGLCAAQAPRMNGYATLPLVVPPRTTYHYLVRVADYLLLLDT